MKNKLESIQALRGLAALLVVLFHYRFYLVPDGTSMSVPDTLFGWGAIGVDFFFVISGFIMVYVTNNKVNGLKTSATFIINRLTRILPVYYIILLFAFLTGGAMSTFHYPEKIANLLSAITFQPYLTHPAPLYIGSSSLYNVRWTLNYEIYFYLIFSLCLLSKKKFIALSIMFFIPLVFSLISLKPITLSTAGYEYNSVLARFMTNPIVLEFGLGVFTGYIFNYLKEKTNFSSIVPSILFLFVIMVAAFQKYLVAYSLLTALCFSVMLLIFALSNDAITNKTPRFFIMLGDISFSWYLLHAPLAGFISSKIEKHHPNITHTAAGFVILVATSIIMAYLSHRFIEIKLTNALREKLKSRKTFVQKA